MDKIHWWLHWGFTVNCVTKGFGVWRLYFQSFYPKHGLTEDSGELQYMEISIAFRVAVLEKRLGYSTILEKIYFFLLSALIAPEIKLFACSHLSINYHLISTSLCSILLCFACSIMTCLLCDGQFK